MAEVVVVVKIIIIIIPMTQNPTKVAPPLTNHLHGPGTMLKVASSGMPGWLSD